MSTDTELALPVRELLPRLYLVEAGARYFGWERLKALAAEDAIAEHAAFVHQTAMLAGTQRLRQLLQDAERAGA